MSIDYTLPNKKNFKLTPEQNDIVEALLNNNRFFNCSQTGIGKTFSTITAALHKLKDNPDSDLHFALVIPNSAEKAFTDCIGKQFDLPYNIYTATIRRTMPEARFHIFNYSTLTSGIVGKDENKRTKEEGNDYLHILFNLKKEHPNLWLICDEVHALQDANSQQYKVMQEIVILFIGGWYLTATPILNDLDGLYNMVDLFIPGYFKNIYSFKSKFQVIKKKKLLLWNGFHKVSRIIPEIIGFKNMDLLKVLLDRIMIVRSKHYNYNFIYKEAALSERDLNFYKLASAGLFSGTKGKKSKKQSTHGARLHDLQRVVSNSHKEFRLNNSPDIVTDKEILFVETLKEIINKDEATLIYFTYLETLDRVKYLLERVKDNLDIPTIHIISGKVSLGKRKKVESGIKPRDVVLITSAGTESLNLQKANNLIFYEIPFALRQFIQACGRITRTDSVFDLFNIYILEAKGTIDTYKVNRIKVYSEPIKAVLRDSNILPGELLSMSLDDMNFMKKEYLWKE